jgi:hypothetical protein
MACGWGRERVEGVENAPVRVGGRGGRRGRA